MVSLLRPGDLDTLPYTIDNAVKSHIDQWREERQICPDFNHGHCNSAASCKYRHGSKNDVCTHWMRGLCKLNARCEFLHIYDMSKMPICHFFQNYGSCKEGDNCQFRHNRQHQAKFECLAYKAGFCKQGPNCKALHVRRELCLRYLAGFCPDGPGCKNGHPLFNEEHILTGEWPDGLMRNAAKPTTGAPGVTASGSSGASGTQAAQAVPSQVSSGGSSHGPRTGGYGQPAAASGYGQPAGYGQPSAGSAGFGGFGQPNAGAGSTGGPRPPYNAQKYRPQGGQGPGSGPGQNQGQGQGQNQGQGRNQWQNQSQGPGQGQNQGQNQGQGQYAGKRPHSEVTCYKCKEPGHYANLCPQSKRPRGD